MSSTKKDLVFPGSNREFSNEALRQFIAHALREDFGKHPSSIKKIGQITNANLRTIRNWYEGCCTPSSRHFISLAKCSPTIRELLFSHVFGREFWDDFALIQNGNSAHNRVTINGTIKLNTRQKWFLLLLQNDEEAAAKHIVKEWGVSFRTARRDIQGLMQDGAIEFSGSKKSGHYNIRCDAT
ncbi:MAG: hypothetical protein CL570_06180 [Alphaproteobacteria bacterium]|nr:hypothetical protein [Alphaproteobacteria bacterium]|tara:strand:+ start:1385 stop:1933 length:549 start_codon:yes stop_codon:yes gene_type:complete